jgi:hypothetical protein
MIITYTARYADGEKVTFTGKFDDLKDFGNFAHRESKRPNYNGDMFIIISIV